MFAELFEFTLKFRSFVKRSDECLGQALVDCNIEIIYQRNDPRHSEEIDNPTEDISLPRDYGIQNLSEYVRVLDQEGKTGIISPSAADVRKLFEHVPGKRNFTQTRNELMVRLFWETALRSDEMSRVKMRNIDDDQREITVRSAKLNRNEHPDLYHRRMWG